MKKSALNLAIIGLLACLPAALAQGQDFRKDYNLPPGGVISIANVSGEIEVKGYNGATLTVTGIREGRDKDVVEIDDQSTAGQVSLKVRYPREGGNYDASVRFIVEVPAGARYVYNSLSTASGDISIENAAGDFNVKSASGDISVTRVEGTVNASAASGDIKVLGASGVVSANTASGDVEVELDRVADQGEFKFTSASGDVTVKVPAQFNAQVEMSTASGSVKTDFPLKVEDREGPGQKAAGTLGSGALKVKLSSASGDVRLLNK